jgi:uncharacterized protein involved in exopolysaccharide biosynthesis
MRSDALNDADEESFDFEAAARLAKFILFAPLRRPKLFALLFLAALGSALLMGSRISPSYRSETGILVQKNVTLPSFADTSRNAPNNDSDPVVGVSEAVKGRDSLIALVDETHLAVRAREMPERLVSLSTAATGPSADEKKKVLAKQLESKLDVKTDGTVVMFSVVWSDPDTAFDLVSAAAQHFLDARKAAEVSIISDAIELLEDHANGEREGIDAAMKEFLQLKEGWRTPATGGAMIPRGIAAPGSKVAGPDSEVAKRLEDKKLQIKELQEQHRKQLAEARGQLAAALGVYTPSHPSVIALQRKLDALADEPSSLTSLQSEERALLGQLAGSAATKSGGGLPSFQRAAPLAGGDIARNGAASRQDLEIADPASAMALSKLQNRIRKYEEFMDQISAARLQLDLARNAFKYRYVVYKPAEVPKSPRYPIGVFAILGGILLGCMLGFGMTGLLDLASGRFIEPWQVKNRLSIPLLGEVMRP